MARMVGVKNEVNAQLLILAIEFRVSILMTDQCCADDTLDGKYTEVIPGTVVRQVACSSKLVSGAKPFVVTIHQSSMIIDDIQTAVGLMTAV